MATLKPRRSRSRRRRIAYRVTALLLVSAIAVNGLAYVHAASMMQFERGAKRPRQPEELTLSEKLKVLATGVRLPRPVNEHNPKDLGLEFKTVRFESTDGIGLEAWDVRKSNAATVVLVFGGYGSCKAKLLNEAKAFHDLGCDVLLVDFRSTGGSTGDLCTIGYREADDVAAAFREAKRRTPQSKVVLFGQSMGSAAILRAIAVHGIDPAAVILECPFASLVETVGNRFTAFGLPAFPLAQLLVFWGGVHGGIDGFSFQPSEYAKAVRCPALLMRGSRDPRVSASEFAVITDNMIEPKKVEVFPGVGHESIFNKTPDKWRKDVGAFLGAL